MRKTLKNTRNNFGYTQKEVSAYLGMCERSYRHIEAGTRGTKEKNWVKLFNLFEHETPLNELMENK